MNRTIGALTLIALTITLVLTPQPAAARERPQIGHVAEVAPEVLKGPHYEIHLANSFKSDIEVAIYFVNGSGNWVAQGWWRLKPGEKKFVARTRNSIFCFYAHTTDRNWVWQGNEKAGENYRYSVRDSKETYSFRKLEMNPKQFVNFTLSIQ